jgi:hypothetical protein
MFLFQNLLDSKSKRLKINITSTKVSDANKIFRLLVSVRMDSHLCRNDPVLPGDSDVIPAQAGIHARYRKKLQENLTAL